MDSSKEREIVLEVGADGGTVTLFRERIAQGDWQFGMGTDESALYDASDEHRGELADYHSRTAYVHSFGEATTLLDKYPWVELYPLHVDPEFLDAVLLEVRKRGGETAEMRWRDVLGVAPSGSNTQSKGSFSQHVSESDVDWILCIELNSNGRFREWLADRIFGVPSTIHEGAWRSVENSFGESDLVWRVRLADNSHLLALIEDKITAIAQPRQYERYVQRGTDYIAAKICGSFETVLVAPQSYTSKDSKLYNKRISYESIQEWFEAQEDERSMFISSMLNAAVKKSESMPKPDAAITQFRRKFWELARDEFPWLGLKEPGDLREYWVSQDYSGFTMVYKSFKNFAQGGFYRSVVDLQLFGRAPELEQLKREYGNEVSALGGEIVVAGKSVAFRIEAQCAHPPAFDLTVARDALIKWNKLYQWWTDKSSKSTSGANHQV